MKDWLSQLCCSVMLAVRDGLAGLLSEMKSLCASCEDAILEGKQMKFKCKI